MAIDIGKSSSSSGFDVRMVDCVVLKEKAEGLDYLPYPGELGQRIYDSVSSDGWKRWIEQLTMVINENALNTSDPKGLALIEDHMRGFLFGEGDVGAAPPEGFQPPGAKK